MIVSYVKIGAVKTTLYLMMSYSSVCTLHIYCDLGELWCKVSEHNAGSVHEFHENWHREDCTFLMVVYEITFLHIL